jgi:hypothetical protein
MSRDNKTPVKLLLTDFTETSIKFVEEFTCIVCNYIASEAVVDKCQHICCKTCITNATCPISKALQREDDIKPIQYIQDKISKQTIYCPKRKLGRCNWSGLYPTLNNHMEQDCPYTPVKCLNKGCCFSGYRYNIEKHIQECKFAVDAVCMYCNGSFPEQIMKTHICEMMPVPCELGCGVSIPKNKMIIHISEECSYADVSCPLKPFGCDVPVKRYELSVHLLDGAHMLIVIKFLKELKESTMSRLTTTCQGMKGYLRKLEEIELLMKKNKRNLHKYKGKDITL